MAEEVMNEIMSGKATPVQMSAYLTALALKGETIDEITASAAGMRAHCIKLLHDMDVLEMRHRRRRFQFFQYIDDIIAGHRSGRRSCGKARQQGSIVKVRCSRRPGGSGSGYNHTA
ncbi:MAG: hypothetical protein V8Q42_11820 [Anaerovoracaceae bacterium]